MFFSFSNFLDKPFLPIYLLRDMLLLSKRKERSGLRKLLIAHSSDIFMSALEDALKDQFQIITCTNGDTLLERLPQYQPDALVLNLMLPYKDGITVLQQTPYLPPVILAITNHLSTYAERAIAALGIDYTMIMPSVEAVAMRLQDLMQQHTHADSVMDIHAKTACLLHQLGFPSHLDGYRQLCIALPLFAGAPHQLVTKELYPAVAALCGSKDSRSVEHSIRKAIYFAWKQRDNATWRKYFTMDSRGNIACPTNKAFICRLAEMLTSP